MPVILKKITQKVFGLPYFTLFTIISGYLSGYPTGAKLAKDMFDEGLADSRQVTRIISVANNCSPLFLIGTIGSGLFKSVKLGFLLLMIHWFSGILAAFLSRIFYRRKSEKYKETTSYISAKSKKNKPEKLSWLITSSIESSALLCIKITGYIVLFAVLSELLYSLGIFKFLGNLASFIFSWNSNRTAVSDFMSSALRGIMEISSGSQAISRLWDTNINLKLSAISFICGFAGFSVHTQVMGIIKDTNAKYLPFFFGKLLHGTIAGFLTFFIAGFMPMAIQTSAIYEISQELTTIRIVTICTLLFSLIVNPIRPKRKLSGRVR